MQRSKVLLISGASPNRAPYLCQYIEILEKHHIEYDVIYQDYEEDTPYEADKHYICYPYRYNIHWPLLKKAYKTLGFCKYATSFVNDEYKLVIIFTIQQIILSSLFIHQRRIPVIFDIRDYSPIMRFPIVARCIKKLINASVFTAISSRGFLQWLPDSNKYLLSHNITKAILEQNNDDDVRCTLDKPPYEILTIGQIRDYEANREIIGILGNNEKFVVKFAGFGAAYNELCQYAADLSNIIFTGRYNKADETKIIQKCDFVNIYMGEDVNSRTLTSNRFYNALLMRKPMIVRSGTYQAQIIKSYNLGVVVSSVDELLEKLDFYSSQFDRTQFNENCKTLIESISNDIRLFETTFIDKFSQL